jgi:uncharacterized membrane protein
MALAVFVHVVAAVFGLLSGFTALSAAKGSRLHRRSGMVFVYAMLTMALSGAGIAAFRGQDGNLVAGLLTAYLVTTGFVTVRPPTPRTRRITAAAFVVALVVGAGSVTLGALALASPRGTRGGIPFVIFFLFGAIALLSAWGDRRVIREGARRGVPRLTRHIWRMCYALWIAAASFFHGPRARVAQMLPEPLLHPLLLALPPLMVLVAMVYWLLRIRRRRGVARIVSVSPIEAI